MRSQTTIVLGTVHKEIPTVKCSCCGQSAAIKPVSYAFVWPGGELSETITDLLCDECVAGAPGRVVIFEVHSVLSRRPMLGGMQS